MHTRDGTTPTRGDRHEVAPPHGTARGQAIPAPHAWRDHRGPVRRPSRPPERGGEHIAPPQRDLPPLAEDACVWHHDGLELAPTTLP